MRRRLKVTITKIKRGAKSTERVVVPITHRDDQPMPADLAIALDEPDSHDPDIEAVMRSLLEKLAK